MQVDVSCPPYLIAKFFHLCFTCGYNQRMFPGFSYAEHGPIERKTTLLDPIGGHASVEAEIIR